MKQIGYILSLLFFYVITVIAGITYLLTDDLKLLGITTILLVGSIFYSFYFLYTKIFQRLGNFSIGLMVCGTVAIIIGIVVQKTIISWMEAGTLIFSWGLALLALHFSLESKEKTKVFQLY